MEGDRSGMEDKGEEEEGEGLGEEEEGEGEEVKSEVRKPCDDISASVSWCARSSAVSHCICSPGPRGGSGWTLSPESGSGDDGVVCCWDA